MFLTLEEDKKKKKKKNDSSILAVLLFFKCEWKHKLHIKGLGGNQSEQTHTFSLTTKDCHHYQYWQTPKTCSQKKIKIKIIMNNDSHICFLCIGCNPRHCGSVFYAWVTARKQSLQALSMRGTQRRGNRSERKKKRNPLAGCLDSRQLLEL